MPLLVDDGKQLKIDQESIDCLREIEEKRRKLYMRNPLFRAIEEAKERKRQKKEYNLPE